MIVRLTVTRDDGTELGGTIPDVSDRAGFKAAVAKLSAMAEDGLFGDPPYSHWND